MNNDELIARITELERDLADFKRGARVEAGLGDEARSELKALRSQNKWLKQQIENIAGQHAPLEPIDDQDGWSRKMPGYDLASLLRDAERYRYMRNFPHANIARSVGITDGTHFWLQFKDADEAIDKAMAEDGGNYEGYQAPQGAPAT